MNVVLATDGRAPAQAAAALLGRLARREKTHVTVVAVSGFETVMTEAERIGRYDPAAGRRRAEEAMQAAVRTLHDAGMRADGVVREGDPAAEILSAAQAAGATLIVVGAGHTRRLDQLLLGSTSTRLLHDAPCSVLVVHRTGSGPVPVVVGTDGSAGSAAATAAFVALADPARTTVRVLAACGVEEAADDDVQRAVREAAVRAADETVATLGAAGFAATSDVAEGEARDLLLGAAERHDLVVVGSRGMGVLRRALLGSVSDVVARQAPATLVGR